MIDPIALLLLDVLCEPCREDVDLFLTAEVPFSICQPCAHAIKQLVHRDTQVRSAVISHHSEGVDALFNQAAQTRRVLVPLHHEDGGRRGD